MLTPTLISTRADPFRLNTDSSVVKFPEIQYICTMTDFEYNMEDRILTMEQRGKRAAGIMSPNNLLRLNLNDLDKPTFFATNSLRDTIAFTSLNAKYNVDKEFIEAENISYIRIADALIQPESGKIKIDRRARIEKLRNAFVAVNNLHLFIRQISILSRPTDIQEVPYMTMLMIIKISGR
jgi:hypothetical protein